MKTFVIVVETAILSYLLGASMVCKEWMKYEVQRKETAAKEQTENPEA